MTGMAVLLLARPIVRHRDRFAQSDERGDGWSADEEHLKTGRPVQFEITEQTRAAIRDWVANSVPGNGQYLFPSRFHDQPHISTRQYARVVHRWVERAGLDSSAYGTHSMRRTKA